MEDVKVCGGCGEEFQRPDGMQAWQWKKRKLCKRWCGYTSRRGQLHSCWKGGRTTHAKGYVLEHRPDHPRSSSGRYVLQHLLIAERVIGQPLPQGACVHHVDENPANNSNDNLVILASNAEHRRLHARKRVADAGGDPWNQKLCACCEEPKDLGKFSKRKNGYDSWCKSCRRDKRQAEEIWDAAGQLEAGFSVIGKPGPVERALTGAA